MSFWNTTVTRQLGVELPLLSAGMGFVALPPLAAAVSEAGGVGLLGASPYPAATVREMIRDVRTRTRRPFGVDFIVAETAFGPATTEAHVEVCVAEEVPLVVFFWNPPPELWLERLRSSGCRVWIQLGTVQGARDAVAMGFDGIIVQGAEAGGHNRSTTGLFSLLPAVVDVAGTLPVIAAGGIADGRGVAAALTLGASGVLAGTRFLASAEAHAHPEYQRRIVEASVEDLVVTRLFGPEWPGEPMRVIRNRVVREWEGRADRTPEAPAGTPAIGRTVLMGEPHPLPKFSSLPPTPDHEGDFEEMALAAGDSAGLIHDVRPACEIACEMMGEAASILRRKAAMAGPVVSPFRRAVSGGGI